jgi:pseudouridine kinase
VVLDNYELDSEAPVLVIGAAGIDIIGRLQGPLEAGTSNPARIRTSFGGTARNVAENLARLGQPVQLLSVIGGDQVGRQLLRHTEKAGVDVSSVQVAATLPTGSYLAVIDTQGQMNFGLDDMRVLEQITPDYLQDQKDLFKSASMLFLDANLHPETLATALALAAEAELPVCADPTSTSLATKLAQHLKQIFLLTPNVREAGVFLDRDIDPRDSQAGVMAAKDLVSLGLLFAIVTLSEFGLAYASAEGSGHIPAFKTEIVDPTGGGDALSAAVIFALLNDIPADEAVRLGLSAASLTLRRRGSVREDLSLELLYDQLVI